MPNQSGLSRAGHLAPGMVVCDVLLPLPPKAIWNVLTVIHRLQSLRQGSLRMAVHIEASSHSAIRMRGFAGINLNTLTRLLQAAVSLYKITDTVTLTYKPGCTGSLARPDGGALQINADCIVSQACSETHRKQLADIPGELLVEFPQAELTLH